MTMKKLAEAKEILEQIANLKVAQHELDVEKPYYHDAHEAIQLRIEHLSDKFAEL